MVLLASLSHSRGSLIIHGDTFVSRSSVYTKCRRVYNALKSVSLDRVAAIAMSRLFLQLTCGHIETSLAKRFSIFQTFRKFFVNVVTMSKFDWVKDKTKLSISLLEGLPHLWDVSQADYKNCSKRTASIEQLAQQFNTDFGEVGRKLYNLRTQFNNELRKTRKRKSGQGSGEVYTSNWEFFEALQFMQSSSKCTETQSNIVSILFYFNV